jgi:hypothetical protein
MPMTFSVLQGTYSFSEELGDGVSSSFMKGPRLAPPSLQDKDRASCVHTFNPPPPSPHPIARAPKFAICVKYLIIRDAKALKVARVSLCVCDAGSLRRGITCGSMVGLAKACPSAEKINA